MRGREQRAESTHPSSTKAYSVSEKVCHWPHHVSQNCSTFMFVRSPRGCSVKNARCQCENCELWKQAMPQVTQLVLVPSSSSWHTRKTAASVSCTEGSAPLEELVVDPEASLELSTNMVSNGDRLYLLQVTIPRSYLGLDDVQGSAVYDHVKQTVHKGRPRAG